MLIMLCVFLACCSYIPTPMRDAAGGTRAAVIVGGKGSLTYNADGSMQFVYTQEKSLQQTWQALTALGMSGFQAWTTIKQELTKQLENHELSLTQRADIAAKLKIVEAQLTAAQATNGKAIDASLFQKEATPYKQQ